jgi:hypothetical protein
LGGIGAISCTGAAGVGAAGVGAAGVVADWPVAAEPSLGVAWSVGAELPLSISAGGVAGTSPGGGGKAGAGIG